MDTESELKLSIEDAGKSATTSTGAADETVEAAKLSKDETSADHQQDATKNDNDDNKDGRRGSSSSAVISPVGPSEVNEEAKLAPVAKNEIDGSAAKAEGNEEKELHISKDEVMCHPNDNVDKPKDATDESRKVETSEADTNDVAELPADGQSEGGLPESDPATDTQDTYADESQQYDESIYSRPPPLPPALAPAAARAERRGSGFLLLAAEAYEAAERTQIRADAIRQVAMELATAAVGGPAPASTASAAESMQRQYQDAMLSQGQGSPGTIGPMYTRYPEVQVDGNIREQVYKAAARIQQQHQAQAAAAPPLESSSQEVEGEEAKSPPTSSMVRGGRRKRATPNRQESLPPLPPAPLVQPTKQPAKIRSSPNGGPPKGKKDSGENDSGKPRPTPQKHVYHDYSSIPDSEHFVRKKTGGVTMPFPEKLMNMLDKESLLHPDIISWLPHGRAFIVRKPKLFTGEVMGGYFRQSKLTSFQRQLNLYGFRRITQGVDGGAYYHELFLRGRPQLSLRMQRQKVKGTGHKQPTDVTSEPNFYAMPALTEGDRNVTAADDDGVAAVETGSFDGPVPPLALPDGALTYSTTRSDVTNSPQPSEEVKAQIQAMWNSPGLTAASMLRQLSASNVNPPPFLGLGASSQGNAAEQYHESSFQRTPSAAMGTYTTAAAATSNPNNASDESDQNVEYV